MKSIVVLSLLAFATSCCIDVEDNKKMGNKVWIKGTNFNVLEWERQEIACAKSTQATVCTWKCK